MCRPRTERVARAVAAAVALGVMLAGCSDIYFDRRDAIALSGGDAVAANEIAQMVDPWPAHSGNVNIPGNGQKMQSAVERYRTNRVYQPANIYNSEVEKLQEAQAAPPGGSASPSSSNSGTSAAAAPPQ